jgi:hypothetical protein
MVDPSTDVSEDIPEDRPLTTEERTLVRWLLLHGEPAATGYLADLEQAWVVSRCGWSLRPAFAPEPGTVGLFVAVWL